MMTAAQRARFDKLLHETLAEVRGLAASDKTRPELWRSILVQLEFLEEITRGGQSPPWELLRKITIGNIAIRELGETEDEVPERLRKVWDDLKTLQSDAFDWYDDEV